MNSMNEIEIAKPRPVALVDCNNFYVSCERVFKPWLDQMPVAVLSNNDGCIVARSNEVKRLGVPMGAPYYQHKKLIEREKIAVFSSNYELYGDMSRRVMTVLYQLASEIEIYSIDEAFVSFSGVQAIEEEALRIRQTVKQWTGIPVSIGVATTKTLAKAASELAKKSNGVSNLYDLSQEELDDVLKKLPVTDVWGVGRKHGLMLMQKGIQTACDLKNLPDEWVRKNLSVVGLRTVWELRGIPCLSVEEVSPPKKAVASTRSFGKAVERLEDLEEAVASYTARAAEKIRHQHSVASALQVFIRTNRFKPTPQYTDAITLSFEEPTNYTPALIQKAQLGLHQIYKKGFKYHKAGIILLGVRPDSCVQLGLFGTDENRLQRQQLMELVDRVNRKHGKHMIGFAATGLSQTWQMKRQKCSPRYTTKWQELMVVKA